ncbi:hypothetical protein L1765_09405 [Microaerobacter geothermalis]|uniref:5'-methylthioadenosine/S-adenosylhomocysteine nucleosidase family protein n=1 Tax=Microaerobacter geothermalis TaxID=674972 RepID=UPI001F239061|nr:hypothetical protein [Microaerobacter geothermalis]MCF6094179.1 hypothetical protein [Microaerobacter geothermalis]
MHYIVTALYNEAKSIIHHFQLKKIPSSSKFQIFGNDEIKLVVSGVGMLSSAIATTHLLTLYRLKHNEQMNDSIINIGISGAVQDHLSIGEPVLVHKIMNRATGKSYYPDILIQHEMREGVLETFAHPVEKSKFFTITGDLVDMEGAGFFDAASSFLPPHHIYCVKIVSDFLEPMAPSQQEVAQLIEKNIPAIAQLIERSKQLHQNSKETLSEEENKLLYDISRNLRLTTTQTHQLYQLAKQYKIRENLNLDFLNPFYHIQVKTKTEGKNYFEQIKEHLIHP